MPPGGRVFLNQRTDLTYKAIVNIATPLCGKQRTFLFAYEVNPGYPHSAFPEFAFKCETDPKCKDKSFSVLKI